MHICGVGMLLKHRAMNLSDSLSHLFCIKSVHAFYASSLLTMCVFRLLRYTFSYISQASYSKAFSLIFEIFGAHSSFPGAHITLWIPFLQSSTSHENTKKARNLRYHYYWSSDFTLAILLKKVDAFCAFKRFFAPISHQCKHMKCHYHYEMPRKRQCVLVVRSQISIMSTHTHTSINGHTHTRTLPYECICETYLRHKCVKNAAVGLPLITSLGKITLSGWEWIRAVHSSAM